jgi:putative lipoic acid-binding regulatory protein
MTKTTLMEFPCLFPVKIIGTNSQLFLDDVKKITIKHFPKFNAGDLTHKMSQKSNYLAITVTVFAENQAMLDALYQDLTKLPDIKMVL